MTSEKKQLDWNNGIRWLLVALYAVAIFVFAGQPMSVPGNIIFMGVPLMILHSVRRYDGKTTAVFLTIAFVVSTFFEDLSIHTGFPFGAYHYNMNMPHIDQVPILVGVFYVALCYLSWTIACLILNHADRHLENKFNLIAVPVVSAFVMCQFDLVQDPSTSTFMLGWIWEDGGGVFGVPLVNFLGWFMTTYIVFQLFALYLSRQQIRQKDSAEMHTRGFWLQPVLIYLFLGCSYIGQYIFQMHNVTAITDLAGNVWNVNNMYETAVTIMVFTMLYSAVLALIHIFSDKELKNKQ